MNFYFYAPKEDDNHRLNWKKVYSKKWEREFTNFCSIAKAHKVKVIVGISPGLDFNFIQYEKCILQNKFSNDYKTLYMKFNYLLNIGAQEIAILYDDLPNNFHLKFDKRMSEGRIHAQLSNQLSKDLNKNIFVVPRVYADELLIDSKDYLKEFGNIIYPNLFMFYCGDHIVSQNINNKSISKVSKIIPAKIIIWDNFYANDYCPRKLFLGPLTGRSTINNLMINPTGMIETDLLIIDIVQATKNREKDIHIWESILKKHNVPFVFKNISMFFLKPYFEPKHIAHEFTVTDKTFESLETLLWKWKSPLSREWYPFLLGLKHDLQLYQRKLSSERINKIQTKPMAYHSLKNIKNRKML